MRSGAFVWTSADPLMVNLDFIVIKLHPILKGAHQSKKSGQSGGFRQFLTIIYQFKS